MKQKPAGGPSSPEQIIRDNSRKTRKQYSAEAKIRIVLDGLHGFVMAFMRPNTQNFEEFAYIWDNEYNLKTNFVGAISLFSTGWGILPTFCAAQKPTISACIEREILQNGCAKLALNFWPATKDSPLKAPHRRATGFSL